MAPTCRTCLGRRDKDVRGRKCDDLKLPADAQISMETLQSINRIMEIEKFKDDELIKFDANLLCLATGKEDPYSFLPLVIE